MATLHTASPFSGMNELMTTQDNLRGKGAIEDEQMRKGGPTGLTKELSSKDEMDPITAIQLDIEEKLDVYELIYFNPARDTRNILEKRSKEAKGGTILKEHHQQELNRAARVITRTIRKCILRKRIERAGERRLGLRRRLEYSRILDDRLSNYGVTMRRRPLEDIESRRAKQHALLDKVCKTRIELDFKIAALKREMTTIGELPRMESTGQLINLLRSTRNPVREKVASMNHARVIKEIREKLIMSSPFHD